MSKLSLSCNVSAKPVPSLPQITQKVTPNLLVLILCLPLSQFLLFIIIQSCVVIVFFFIANNIKFYTKVSIKTLYRNRICYFAYFLIASLLKIGLYQTSLFSAHCSISKKLGCSKSGYQYFSICLFISDFDGIVCL